MCQGLGPLDPDDVVPEAHEFSTKAALTAAHVEHEAPTRSEELPQSGPGAVPEPVVAGFPGPPNPLTGVCLPRSCQIHTGRLWQHCPALERLDRPEGSRLCRTHHGPIDSVSVCGPTAVAAVERHRDHRGRMSTVAQPAKGFPTGGVRLGASATERRRSVGRHESLNAGGHETAMVATGLSAGSHEPRGRGPPPG